MRYAVIAIALAIAACSGPTREESAETYQYRSAELQFRWNLCKQECFPGTLARYDSFWDECYCHPPVR